MILTPASALDLTTPRTVCDRIGGHLYRDGACCYCPATDPQETT